MPTVEIVYKDGRVEEFWAKGEKEKPNGNLLFIDVMKESGDEWEYFCSKKRVNMSEIRCINYHEDEVDEEEMVP